ncbi:MAG: hypothetical protein OEW08_00785 [Gammaproteobacteria bacterium]|nr:hypothetical protein [Gammaproteobacteria bacterium]
MNTPLTLLMARLSPSWRLTYLLGATFALVAFASGCANLRHTINFKKANNAQVLSDDGAERAFIARATEAKAKGEHALALANWEIAALLRPNNDQIQHALRDARHLIINQTEFYLKEANQAQHDGKYDVAEVALLNILRYDPEHSEAHRRLRHLELTQAKNLEVAKLERTRRFYLGPNGGVPTSTPMMGAENPHQLGIELFEQGKFDEAIGEFKAQLQRHPRDRNTKHYIAQSYLMLAEEQEKDGSHEKALKSYALAKQYGALDSSSYEKRSEGVKQKLADNYYNQGLTAFRDDINNAVRLLEMALKFNPSHAAAALKLKQARTMQKNLLRFAN